MNRLKLLREKHNMKQSELGKLLNVKDAAISKYESGKVPLTDNTLIELSKIFNVSIDYLLCNDTFDNHSNSNNKTYTSPKPEEILDDKRKHFLNIYEIYLDKGFSEQLKKDLLNLFPEMEKNQPILSRSEEKILTTFKSLNEDNQDIIIGKTKELLREQRYEESIAEENLIRKAK